MSRKEKLSSTDVNTDAAWEEKENSRFLSSLSKAAKEEKDDLLDEARSFRFHNIDSGGGDSIEDLHSIMLRIKKINDILAFFTDEINKRGNVD